MSLSWRNTAGTTTTGDVNEELTARFSFVERGIRAFYIDWDDGESNLKDEANYQWVQLSEPKSTFDVTHTYNKSGSFSPVVQFINTDGFASRYYSKEASNADVVPFTQRTAISGVTISDIDGTGVMRVENTTVKSGIDNSILEEFGPRPVFLSIAPTIEKSELEVIGKIMVEIEMVVSQNTMDSTTNAVDALGEEETQHSALTKQITQQITLDVSSSGIQNGLVNIMNSTDTGVSLSVIEGSVNKILKVKYLTPWSTGSSAANPGMDYTKNEIFNRLKIFLITKYDYSDTNYSTITYVTAGQPIKSVDDSDRKIMMDMSQSRAAASNVAISNYRYDLGKMWFSPVNPWTLSTDTLGTGTKQTTPTK